MQKHTTLIYFFLPLFLMAQFDKTDSLLEIINKNKPDTNLLNTYNYLGDIILSMDIDSAISCYASASNIRLNYSNEENFIYNAEGLIRMAYAYHLKNNNDKSVRLFHDILKQLNIILNTKNPKLKRKTLYLMATAYYKMGLVQEDNGENYSALKYYNWSYNIYEKIGYKSGAANSLVNIGNVYLNLGQYNKAMDCYLDALKIYEDMGNKFGQAIILGSLGNIYCDQNNHYKALEYYIKATRLCAEIKDSYGLAANYGNLGIVYQDIGDYNRAIDFFKKAINIAEENNLKVFLANNYGNMGGIYMQTKKYPNSLYYYEKAEVIFKELNNYDGLATVYCNIGEVYTALNNYQNAEKYFKKSESLYNKLGKIFYLKNVYLGLSELYKKNKNHEKALDYYKNYINLRDSILNEENKKSTEIRELKFQFEKDKAIKNAEYQKQLELEKQEKNKQRIINLLILLVLIMVVLFLFFIIKRLNITRKQKNIIENQKLIVEEQKKIVEQKNKDITDSIKYSKRIQDAILPHPQKWKKYLPESFILYLPKDIVAGDFYWMEVLDNFIYIAAADCTGHGVPGAMVSVVCSNALTKAVLEEKITNTDEILNRVREIVIEKLSSEENIKDGMDICLVRLKKNSSTIQYSGANRPLYIVSPVAEYVTRDCVQAGTEATVEGGGFDTPRYSTTDENQPVTEYVTENSVQAGTEATGIQFIELKPDKQPIGRYEEMRPFSKQEVVLQKNSMLYLCTDGYADQFGGEKGKKIGTKAFKELLKENALIEHSEKQREYLFSYFQKWKTKEEQVDDVTAVGVKLILK